jgi:transcriptional regulator with XRE-family HTH domain
MFFDIISWMKASTIVRDARRESRLSQRELARRAGIPQASVSRIERGLSDPRADTLDRLLRVCQKDVELVTRPGTGVDVTLIHELLAMTPSARLRRAALEARNLESFLRSATRR